MRIELRSGSLFLALGVALAGCGQSANTPATVSKSTAKQGSPGLAFDVAPGSAQVVLTVEGMS